MEYTHPLGQWLREQGITRRQFAAQLPCSVTYLSEVLNRRKVPSMRLIQTITEQTGGAVRANDFMPGGTR